MMLMEGVGSRFLHPFWVRKYGLNVIMKTDCRRFYANHTIRRIEIYIDDKKVEYTEKILGR